MQFIDEATFGSFAQQCKNYIDNSLISIGGGGDSGNALSKKQFFVSFLNAADTEHIILGSLSNGTFNTEETIPTDGEEVFYIDEDDKNKVYVKDTNDNYVSWYNR